MANILAAIPSRTPKQISDKISHLKRTGQISEAPRPAINQATTSQSLQRERAGKQPPEEEKKEPNEVIAAPPAAQPAQVDECPWPYWVINDNTHTWFIFQEFKGYSFKLQPTVEGVNVLWTLAEPTENMLQAWGVPTRVIHTQVTGYQGAFFIPSPYPLVLQRDLISVIKSPDYRVLKMMVQGEEPGGVLEF